MPATAMHQSIHRMGWSLRNVTRSTCPHGSIPCQTVCKASASIVASSAKESTLSSLQASPSLHAKLAAVERWVVFSDLHVHDRHDPQWRLTLQAVDRLAREHDAGCLFLGDFWEARTSVRHSTLNQVRQALSDWPHPTIAIVGNHDQVNNSGSEHGLFVLEMLSSNWTVITDPTFYRGALWLPYRSEGDLLASAVAEAMQHQGDGVKAIFAHVDIIGASVNNAYQSRAGLPPDLFPRGITVYSGHYHKPHTVPSTNITYVGSPFEMSFAESQQQKRVLLLNSEFQLVESIPVSIGRQHHILPLARVAKAAGSIRAGDRVRVEVPFEQRREASSATDQLQSLGAEVEVVLQKPEFRSARGAAVHADLLQPHELLAQYLQQAARYHGDSAEAKLLQALQERGTAILARVLKGRQQQAVQDQSVAVQLDKVRIEGFRCFKDVVEYDLRNRGLALLTGLNEQDVGSSSNGAGKTALAVAASWAISGAMGPWAEVAGRGSMNKGSIVNHGPKVKKAIVTLSGRVNSKEFVVTRSVSEKGRGTLKFELGGEDVTGGTMAATQALIDRHLSRELPTVLFHNQQGILQMLASNDRDFKSSLASLVDLALWEDCEEAAKADAAAATRQRSEAQGELTALQKNFAHAKGRWEGAQRAVDEGATRLKRARSAAASTKEQLRGAVNTCSTCIKACERDVQAAEDALRELKQARSDHALASDASDDDALLEALPSEQPQRHSVHLEDLNARVAAATAAAAAAEAEERQRWEALAQCRSQLADSQSRSAALQQRHSHLLHLSTSPTCDRCQQPIDPELHQTILAETATLREACEQQRSAAESACAEAEDGLRRARSRLAANREELRAHASARDDGLRQLQAWQQQLERQQQQLERERLQVEARRREHAAARERAARDAEKAFQQRLALAERDAHLGGLAVSDARRRLQHVCNELGQEVHPAAGELGTAAGLKESMASLKRSLSDMDAAVLALQRAQEDVRVSEAQQTTLQSHLASMEQELAHVQEERDRVEARLARADEECVLLKELRSMLSRQGVQHFVLDTVVRDLDAYTSDYLAHLTSSFKLMLCSEEEQEGVAGKDSISKVIQRIVDGVVVQDGADLATLSTGERRRVALALCLGYIKLVQARGRCTCNVLILDEVHTNLDEEGVVRVVGLLEQLGFDTVLLVGQAGSQLVDLVDTVDVVVKAADGTSSLRMAH